MNYRNIAAIVHNPWRNGFLGPGHRARPVLDGVPYRQSDPFILFMDDDLDLPGGEPVGGAHPHAGIETLTLVLEGKGKEWETGNFELMTAGRGIVHTEEITSKQKLRILQVWLVLSPENRKVQPLLQKISLRDVPQKRTDEYEMRVYSGSSNGLISPIRNHTPFTLVDFRLRKGAKTEQDLPSHYNGLVYVLEGSVKAGGKLIKAEQTGILEQITEQGKSLMEFEAAEDARFLLYAGQPHGVPVVHHGPFVAGSMEEIRQMYLQYRQGVFPHLNDLQADRKISYP